MSEVRDTVAQMIANVALSSLKSPIKGVLASLSYKAADKIIAALTAGPTPPDIMERVRQCVNMFNAALHGDRDDYVAAAADVHELLESALSDSPQEVQDEW